MLGDNPTGLRLVRCAQPIEFTRLTEQYRAVGEIAFGGHSSVSGTGSSNPAPSSGESTNFRFLSRRRPLFAALYGRIRPPYPTLIRLDPGVSRGLPTFANPPANGYARRNRRSVETASGPPKK